MNANKQDAGGLPELPKPAHFDDYAGEWYWTGSQMRAYGELCRAAPAGGECQHEWQPDADVMNARYCPKCDVTQTLPRKSTKDSAPAGSGEVGPILIHAQQLHLDGHMDQCALDELTALLRKLQQGADGWRPIESAPKEDGLKILGASNAPWTQDYYPVLVYEGYRYGSNKQYFGWQAPFDHDDRAPDPTHWMPLPAPPASQGQEGGHARD